MLSVNDLARWYAETIVSQCLTSKEEKPILEHAKDIRDLKMNDFTYRQQSMMQN